ncbi:hypothetical protein HCUR_01429 [Holospora curviuscula]|uniref:Uncharacterized protein n=1 Tax=Holospora curviuscula TaxID=1082868 RepID=A0A2S5R781_9PROT|nr:hypothetical protein HCUR_01429 [Holospora curviuscula]
MSVVFKMSRSEFEFKEFDFFIDFTGARPKESLHLSSKVVILHVDEGAILLEITTYQTIRNFQFLVGTLGKKIYLISVGSKIQDDLIRLMAMDNAVRT